MTVANCQQISMTICVDFDDKEIYLQKVESVIYLQGNAVKPSKNLDKLKYDDRIFSSKCYLILILLGKKEVIF